MRVAVQLLTAVSLAVSVGLSFASKGLPEGAARFSVYLSVSQGLDRSDEFVVNVWSWFPPNAKRPALVRVDVISGAQVVHGEIEHEVTDSGGSFPVRLRRAGTEPIELRCTLRLPGEGPSSYYLARSLLVMRVEGNQLVETQNRLLQQIGVLNGIRFRYGAEYPVVVDEDETESPVEFSARPQLLRASTAKCESCGLKGPIDVEAVVTVGRDGSVTWIRPKPLGEGIENEVWEAAKRELMGFRFQPALSRGKAVADYAIVSVKVLPSEER